MEGWYMNLKKSKVVKTLAEKQQEFLRFLPDHMHEEFMMKSYIAGGAIFSLYNEEEPKDYDFFVTDENFAIRLRNIFNLNSSLKYKNGIKIGTHDGETLIVTDNAVSIGQYQIITRWIGAPAEVISQFDFLHNMFYFYKGMVQNVANWKYLEEKTLHYNEKRARDICGTIIRTNKFVKRGFTITHGEMAKMLLKLHDVGFNERELEILNSFDKRNDFES